MKFFQSDNISNISININSGIPSERFISNIDEFICTVCTDVVKNPVYFTCSHMLCLECYLQLQNKSCPSCSTNIAEYSSPPFIIKNLYNKLTLRCNNFKKGCEFTDSLSDIENHERDCQYNLFTCPDCEEQFIILNRTEHENTCEKREIFLVRKMNEDLNRAIIKSNEDRDLAIRQRDEGADFRLIINSNRMNNKYLRDINRLEAQIEILNLQNREKQLRIMDLEKDLDASYSYAFNANTEFIDRRHTGKLIGVFNVPIHGEEHERVNVWSCCGNNFQINKCSFEMKRNVSMHRGEFMMHAVSCGYIYQGCPFPQKMTSQRIFYNLWTCCGSGVYNSECKKTHTGFLQLDTEAKQGCTTSPNSVNKYYPERRYEQKIWEIHGDPTMDISWSCCGKKFPIHTMTRTNIFHLNIKLNKSMRNNPQYNGVKNLSKDHDTYICSAFNEEKN
jgi:hypothetical protein